MTDNKYFRIALIIAPCVLFLILDIFVYDKIGALAASRHIDYDKLVQLSWDIHIPYVSWFILPYIFAWGYPLVGLFQVFRRTGINVNFYMRLYFFVLLIFVVDYVLWILFPVSFDYTYSLTFLAQGNWLDQLTLWVYHRSSLYNSCPSFHIVPNIFVYFVVRYMTKDPYYLNLLLVSLICLSTLFIRMHYIIDVVTGIILGYAFYRAWLYTQCRSEVAYRRTFLKVL
jgi:hypothetical protein